MSRAPESFSHADLPQIERKLCGLSTVKRSDLERRGQRRGRGKGNFVNAVFLLALGISTWKVLL